LGQAPKYPKRTLRGARQPGIELRPLALAEELDNVFRQGDGLRQCTRLGAQLGQLLGLDRGALVLPSYHQPRHSAGRERWLPGFTDRYPGLA
jgi:hypothetical protein